MCKLLLPQNSTPTSHNIASFSLAFLSDRKFDVVAYSHPESPHMHVRLWSVSQTWLNITLISSYPTMISDRIFIISDHDIFITTVQSKITYQEYKALTKLIMLKNTRTYRLVICNFSCVKTSHRRYTIHSSYNN